MTEQRPTGGGWRERLHEIIVEADTPAGKAFDVALLILIGSSVTAVLLESVESVEEQWGTALRTFEWIVTGLFTVEYVARLLIARRPAAYAGSFYGVVDVLAVLPTYLSLLIPGAQSLLVIRAFRLLRVFRVFKLAHFVGEATELRTALRASRQKITVFLTAVGAIVLIVGSAMYLIEGDETEGFSSIPESIYFTVVTITTVGFGDIAPETPLGRFLTSIVSLLGYGIIAVPTGIVTAEIAFARRGVTTRACPSCATEGHDPDASHCKYCGVELYPTNQHAAEAAEHRA